MVTAVSDTSKSEQLKGVPFRLSAFASVKLTVLLLVLIATTVLIGAWCPQEAQQGRDKVIETFGSDFGAQLIKYGIADIYHSPFFLGLIGLLTVNMVACSVQRVFPKVRSLAQPMPLLKEDAIAKMTVCSSAQYAAPANLVLQSVQSRLRSHGYVVSSTDNRLAAHWGKCGRLAPTITHIGLLMLLLGVTITSWTGFNGFQAVPLHGVMSFDQSEHSKLWLGQLPQWALRVDATRRENYDNGDAKQWYSTLSVVDSHGKVLKKQEISVNNPLSFQGVDIYQSSWGLGSIAVSFNGKRMELPLRQMGPVIHAAFLPLDHNTIMMFSVHGQDEPVRVFAKIPEWPQPRILTVLAKGQPTVLGSVQVRYDDLIPVTGLQYKCDPGLFITYAAFAFIMLGVILAAVPHRQLWVDVIPLRTGGCRLVIGGVSRKAKSTFEKNLAKLRQMLDREFAPLQEEEASCPMFN
ncbi:MAG TPA: cytochrome c biogenesis protein ResB [Candidatus Obscuribacterales bacterium]